MDFPCVQWQDHVAQKWIGLDPQLKETLTSQLEIDDLFKCTLTLTTQDDLDFVESISPGYSVEKDAELAAKCRERGNSSFKTRDYPAAALHYSQGICLAPHGSDQVPLCYANRSAALHHLQHYQESVDDMDHAVKNSYPSHLLHKLEGRRTSCLKHLSVALRAEGGCRHPASKNPKGPDAAGGASVGLLTFGICPQAAVGFSSEKGRHLVAAEGVAAGDVLLHDRPYGFVLIPGMEDVKGKGGGRRHAETGVLFGTEHRRCHGCLSETLSPVPCEGCSYSRYCSIPCQRDAWEEHHRWECPLGADLRMMGVMPQLALRIALKAGLKNIKVARVSTRDEHKGSQPSSPNGESSGSDPGHPDGSDPCTSYHGDSYPSVFHLQHHLNLHSPEVRFLCAVTIATLFLKLSKAGPSPASRDLSRLLRADSQSPEREGCTADWSANAWLLGSAALRHVLQLRCNAQAILTLEDTGAANSPVQSSSEIRIATAMFPTLSLLNHSCCPNTSLQFSTGTSLSADCTESGTEYGSTARGVTVTVRASKAIPPGQEILHCYGPHSSRMATRERQRLLQEQYYFLCHCEACTQQEEEEDEEDEAAAKGFQSRPQWSGFGGGLVCGKCKGSLKQSSEEGAKGFVCLQSSCGCRVSAPEVSRRLQEIKAHLEQAVHLMETERPGEALRLLMKAQSQPGLIFAETHPVQGELADAIARAYATMGDWNNAASHLERSAVAIGAQYGEDSIELGRQLFKLAQLHFNGGARGPALSVIAKVKQLFCLHGGPLCDEIQELQAMEDCLL
ncbi:SET and MYND domain-containing protein 4 isoform 2-T2 [Spinachia spinachia]